MDARVEKLISSFQNNGWKLVGSADISGDWWFQDIFQLTSTWSPLNKNLYITLLVDPMTMDKTDVWAIAISSEIPGDQHHKFLDQITLNDVKRTDLDAFVKRINKTVLTGQ